MRVRSAAVLLLLWALVYVFSVSRSVDHRSVGTSLPTKVEANDRRNSTHVSVSQTARLRQHKHSWRSKYREFHFADTVSWSNSNYFLFQLQTKFTGRYCFGTSRRTVAEECFLLFARFTHTVGYFSTRSLGHEGFMTIPLLPCVSG